MVMGGIDGSRASGMTPPRPPGSNANDEVSRGLEQQIQQKQKQMAELKQDETMSAEQKMKRRQELQKEISELQMQMRQHELEVRQRERQERNAARQEKDNLATENGQTGSGKRTQGGADMAISNVMTKSMLSAGSTMKMAKVQQGTKKQLQGKANVLKAEIKQGGGNEEKKQKEADALEGRATKLEDQQMSSLSDLNEQIRKDAREDQKVTQEEKAAEKKRAEKAAEKKKAKEAAQKEAEEKRIEERRENKVQIERNGETVESDGMKMDGKNEAGMKVDGVKESDIKMDGAAVDNHIDVVSGDAAVGAVPRVSTGVGGKVDVAV